MQANLINSPIYNMSMCSLENFHTCFWKWIGNTYKNDFLKVFIDKDNLNEDNIEYNDQVSLSGFKLDLEIKYKENNREKRIIIENKIKSFPTNEQLEKYSKEALVEDNIFILTSLAPKFDIPKPWIYLSYSKIADNMAKIFNDSFKYKDIYHKGLIKDYINVIRQLSLNFPCCNSEKYDFYIENEAWKIGLRDIYVKYKTSQLQNYIKNKVKFDDICISTDFRNKQGIINIFREFDDYNIPLTLLIQIQYDEYRYCLIYDTDENNKREKLAQELNDKGLWFNKSKTIDLYPKARIYKSKKFCGYAPSFIYKYQTLEKLFNKKTLSDVSYEEIAQQIKQDIENLKDNETRIVKIFVSDYL